MIFLIKSTRCNRKYIKKKCKTEVYQKVFSLQNIFLDIIIEIIVSMYVSVEFLNKILKMRTKIYIYIYICFALRYILYVNCTDHKYQCLINAIQGGRECEPHFPLLGQETLNSQQYQYSLIEIIQTLPKFKCIVQCWLKI